jgi:hypothetical protein
MQEPTAPTSVNNPPASTPVSEATFITLLDEVNQRLTNAEATNAILVAEIDALAAEVAELKASAT